MPLLAAELIEEEARAGLEKGGVARGAGQPRMSLQYSHGEESTRRACTEEC